MISHTVSATETVQLLESILCNRSNWFWRCKHRKGIQCVWVELCGNVGGIPRYHPQRVAGVNLKRTQRVKTLIM